MMFIRRSRYIGLLYLTLFLLLSVASVSAESHCIEIHKYNSTGLLNLDTGDYSEFDNLKTLSHVSPNGQYTLRQSYSDSEKSSRITIVSNLNNRKVQTIADITPPIYLQEGRWSPDSRKMAFLSSYPQLDSPTTTNLTIIDMPDGTISNYIYDTISYSTWGNWSPDSAYLSFTLSSDIDNHSSYFFDAHTGNTIPVPVAWSEIMVQSWLPKGHRLILIREIPNQQEMLLIEPEEGIVKSVVLPLHITDPKITYSPNEKYFAVYGYINCDQDGHPCDPGTVIFQEDGTSPQIVMGSIYGVPDWSAFWSGNDKVWLSLRESASPPDFALSDSWEYKDLVANYLADGTVEVLQANMIVPNYYTRLPGSYYGSSASYFSADKQQIFMVYHNQRKIVVALADTEGQNRQVIIDNASELAPNNAVTTYYPCTACQTIAISLSNPAWIGDYLLMKWQDGQNTRLTWIRADNSEHHELSDANSIENIISPSEAHYIVYRDTDSKEINILNLETGQYQPIFTPTAEHVTDASPWYVVMSPDQSWVVLMIGGAINDQYLINLNNFHTRKIDLGTAFLAGPTWSPDSSYVSFLKSNPDGISLMMVALNANQVELFNVGQSNFWFPREFISRGGVMEWTNCS